MDQRIDDATLTSVRTLSYYGNRSMTSLVYTTLHQFFNDNRNKSNLDKKSGLRKQIYQEVGITFSNVAINQAHNVETTLNHL